MELKLNLPDDQGRHDVVERVELGLAAQHQGVLDAGEVLQNLRKKFEPCDVVMIRFKIIWRTAPVPPHNSLSTVLFEL